MNNEKNIVMLSTKRVLFILVLYFLGFQYALPKLLKSITLWLDPNAYIINIPILLLSYVIMTVILIYLSLPLWKTAYEKTKGHGKECLYQIIGMIVIILLANFLFSLIVSIFTQTNNSQNQQIVEENAKISPLYSFLYTSIMAPIMEEIVFRGGIYHYVRSKWNQIAAIILSSFLFGFVHVSSSFFSGNFVDVAYLLVYGFIGAILAISYEKSDNLLIPVGVHMGNNLFAFLMMIV